MGSILALVASPVVRYAGIALAVIAVLAYVRYDAAQDARQAAELAHRKAVAEAIEVETQRQREAAQRAVSAAEHRAKKIEADQDALQQKVDRIVAGLRASPGDACRLDDDLLRELQSIR